MDSIDSLSIANLRKKYSTFIYHSYRVHKGKGFLKFKFEFSIEPGIHFSPAVVFEGVDSHAVDSLGEAVINNLAFNLGLIEIPSYWKATCSPKIQINCGRLDAYQTEWWKELIANGMGEYFYVNDIDFEQSDFLNLRSRGGGFQVYTGKVDQHKLLIPISGGKDSIVTIELLNDSCVKRLHAWCLNPTRQMLTVVKTTKVHGPLVVRRAIDPKLLQLNSSGYLNGHTPFSAYLAFASIVSAVLGDFGAVVVSHERSSNEGNVLYRGRIINHQYSKSYQFEKKFRDYLNRYLAGGIDYFSLLRPLYELQIAGIFSKFPKYFSLVKSCNRGLRTNTWCHKCPKCVFVFASLYPFIETSVLTSVIFSRNLFEDEKLADLAFQLLTKAKVKPFECVGTREETLIAFNLCIDKAIKTGLPLPQVLTRVSEKILIHEKNLQHRTQAILSGWTNEHQVPENLGLLVKKALWL